MIEKGQAYWREKMFDSFTAPDDICFVNLPKDTHEVEDSRNFYVYAGYLKPCKHQIVIFDELKNTYWLKNIIVDHRMNDVKPKLIS